MSFPRYAAYKDSGVEWLGEVPEHWEVLPLKRNARLLTEKTDARLNPIALENIEGWTGKLIETETEFQGEGVAFQIGDVLFGKLRPYLAKVYLASQPGEAVGDFHVIRPSASLRSRFLQYQLLTNEVIDLVNGSTYGAKMPRASWNFLGTLATAVPSPDEQQLIAAFLDRETAKIDALIAEQQRLIELLQEKRQAVISHAVTKGLNPDAPMKDSGVEWLGEVPEHWEVRPLKSEIFFQEGPGIMAVDFVDEGIPLLRVACVQGEKVTLDGCNYLDPLKVASKWSHFAVREGDLLLSGSASLGGVSEVDQDAEGAIPYTGLIRIRPLSKNITRDFIRLLIESSVFSIQIDRLKAGATIQHFGPTHLNQMKITLPPKDEQEAIAKELRLRKTAYQGLNENAIQAVSLLQERRSALISAAVTGQIDVRGLVAEASAE